jgi:hypothetical protein
MLTVNFDRLNIISSGSVGMKIDAKECFLRRRKRAIFHLAAISQIGRNLNVDCTDTYSHKVQAF